MRIASMGIPALHTAAETLAPPSARTLASRLSALYRAVIESRAARAASVGETSLADLNDETLIDLGFDPASVRHVDGPAFSARDQMARYYL
jgi:hypothetical protein